MRFLAPLLAVLVTLQLTVTAGAAVERCNRRPVLGEGRFLPKEGQLVDAPQRKDPRDPTRYVAGGASVRDFLFSLVWHDSIYDRHIPFGVAAKRSGSDEGVMVAEREDLLCMLSPGDSILIGDGADYHWSHVHRIDGKAGRYGIWDKIPERFPFRSAHNLAGVTPTTETVDGNTIYWFSEEDMGKILVGTVSFFYFDEMERLLKTRNLMTASNKRAFVENAMSLSANQALVDASNYIASETEKGELKGIDASFYVVTAMTSQLLIDPSYISKLPMDKVTSLSRPGKATDASGSGIGPMYLERELKFNIRAHDFDNVEAILEKMDEKNKDLKAAVQILLNLMEMEKIDWSRVMADLDRFEAMLVTAANEQNFDSFMENTYGAEDDTLVLKIFEIYRFYIGKLFKKAEVKSEQYVKNKISQRYYYSFIYYKNKYANVEENCEKFEEWKKGTKKLGIKAAKLNSMQEKLPTNCGLPAQ